MQNWRGKFWVTLTLFAVLFVAAFFRFAYLNNTPSGLWVDEAMNAVDARETMESGDFKVFYPDNNGREGLYINLVAVTFNLFGPGAQTMRALSGIFGILMVLGLFLLTRELYNYKIALLASYLAAVSFWAVNFSRIGFRAIMLPAILVWSFWLLWVGIRKKSVWPVALSGLIFGLGMHSYISFRMAPFILLALLAIIVWINPVLPRKQTVRLGVIFFVGAIITASPLLLYYLENPADFLGRATQVSIFAESSPIKSFGGAILKTLGMFSFYGDTNWRHNLPGRPLLGYILGAVFILGFLLLIKNALNRKTIREHFLLIWFFVMLLPNFLAPEGAPHALRALGVQPVVYIISALALFWLYDLIQGRFGDWAKKFPEKQAQAKRIQKEIAVLFVAFLALFGAWEAKIYFLKWGSNPSVSEAFTQRLVDIGKFTTITSAQNKYVVLNEGGVIVDGLPIPAQVIKFNAWQEDINFVIENEIGQLPENISNSVIIISKDDDLLLAKLRNRYPSSTALQTPTFTGIRVP